MTIQNILIEFILNNPFTTFDDFVKCEERVKAKNTILRLTLLNPELLDIAFTNIKNQIIKLDELGTEDDFLEYVFDQFVACKNVDHKSELVINFIGEIYIDYINELIDEYGFDSALFLRIDFSNVVKFFNGHPFTMPLDTPLQQYIEKFEYDLLDFTPYQLLSLTTKTTGIPKAVINMMEHIRTTGNKSLVKLLDKDIESKYDQMQEAVTLVNHRILERYSGLGIGDLFYRRKALEPMKLTFIKEELDLDEGDIAIFHQLLNNNRRLIVSHTLSFKIEPKKETIEVEITIEKG